MHKRKQSKKRNEEKNRNKKRAEQVIINSEKGTRHEM